jgi:hypothetical protein
MGHHHCGGAETTDRGLVRVKAGIAIVHSAAN